MSSTTSSSETEFESEIEIESPNEYEFDNTFSNIINPNTKSYDVYLSFYYEDADFLASDIYAAISDVELAVFWDPARVNSQDQEILTSYLNVIGDCHVVVIIFSKNYTNSRWCLQELEKITQCCRTRDGPIVLPVFYRPLVTEKIEFQQTFYDFVDRISAEEEISKEEDKFMTWVATISSKATTYAQESDDFESGNNTMYINGVVEYVAHMLRAYNSFSHVLYTASAKSRARDVIQLLKQSKRPLLIGIWGMAGVGKKTIAQAIYDQIGPYFEHKSCFGVSTAWRYSSSQLALQRNLALDMGGVSDVVIPTIESGKVILKERFQHKRVLIIIHGVDKLEQLKALCGNRDWFSPGSKIIIATTNRHILKEHGVDHIYRVKELDESESLEVFNRYAFRQATSPLREFADLDKKVDLNTFSPAAPPEGFGEFAEQLVAYCGGLPHALKEIGISLIGQEIHEWKGVLRSLERFSIPSRNLLYDLENCFSDLSDKEKQIFLDIACFFNRVDQNDVLQILNRSTKSAALQISLLEDKSFVTIDENNKLEIHVMLQVMARDIIKKESSNMTNQPKMYDVFLSFRGEDSRAKFMSHLYSSLQNAGIYAFRDDDEIQRGDQISMSLLRAIGLSRISIIVLSTNYANSRWCMLELERIMEIRRTLGLVVVPVFYEVDPAEVRRQEGQFGKAFKELISTIPVDVSTESNWRRELFDIGSIAGFVLINSRNESADIKNIVECVTRLLDRKELFVAEHPVGVESRVTAATKLLNIQKSEDVLILGIWGMGGMGKTTIAKAIYNQIGSMFEGRSFLLNIREFWQTHTNQVSLQQKVLSDVYKTTTFKIHNIESGKNILKERLSQNTVLLVLDDVSELDQLRALCGSHQWFGPGSRIIITTRDLHLLKSCGVYYRVYRIEEMGESESLELFSWHAFNQSSPIEDFATHSTDVIAYAGGLPLALQVLGSYLSDCEITVWQKVLDKLKCIPHDEVQKKLKVSFDGLKDITEKQIFLDIACFFIGMDRSDVIQILNGCGLFADIGIKVLEERSLVTLDNKNKLRMHDLLRDMGRQIIYEESPFDPEDRSRLWRCDEVVDILSNDKGTRAIKGLALEFPKKTLSLNTMAFEKMNKLRLLKLAGVRLKGDYKNFTTDLRWLYWHGFSETCAPAKFQQGSLVAVILKYSNLKQIWNKSKVLENLKILNLSHSRDLTKTPEFSFLPNLEKLILKDCPSLSKVSHSIGSLHKLLLINLTDCTGLRKLPRNIYKLKSLETLILSGCSMIDKLEEDLEQMESLTTLVADKTAITKVPFSIVKSKRIGYISLCGFKGFSRDVFPSIIWSWMSPSNNVISRVKTSLFISSLGTSKDLLKLRILCVECGSQLQLNQYVAKILDVLKATNCYKKEVSAIATTSQISDIHATPLIDDSLGHVHISRSKNYLKSLLIQMGTKCPVSTMTKESIFQPADGTWGSILLPSDNKSNWFTFSCKSCSVSFDVPMKGSFLKSVTLFVVYSSPDKITSEGCQGVLIINYTKATIQTYKSDTLTSFGNEDWQTITSNLEPGNKVEVMVVFGEGFIVEKTTISLLYDELINTKMELCDAVDEEDVIVSESDNVDVPVDNSVTGPAQDENTSEDKHECIMYRKRKRGDMKTL